MKTCSKCKEWKADDEFYRNCRECKKCDNERSKNWSKVNADHLAAYQKDYRESSKDALIQYHREQNSELQNECIVNGSIDVNKAYFEAVMKKRRAEYES